MPRKTTAQAGVCQSNDSKADPADLLLSNTVPWPKAERLHDIFLVVSKTRVGIWEPSLRVEVVGVVEVGRAVVGGEVGHVDGCLKKESELCSHADVPTSKGTRRGS